MLGSWVRAPDGSQKRLLETGAFFVCVSSGAIRKCSCLSTEMVPSVEVRCPEVAFVHGWGCFCGCRREMQPPVHTDGAWCGRTVPGGGICPRLGVFLWMPQRNATACPRRGCPAWTHGARRDKCYFRVIVSPGFTSPLIIFSASGSSM